jgi:hypothetical protein
VETEGDQPQDLVVAEFRQVDFGYIQRNYITKYHLLSIVFESHQLNRVRLRPTSRCLAFNLLSVHSPPLAFYAASMFCLFFTRRRKS